MIPKCRIISGFTELRIRQKNEKYIYIYNQWVAFVWGIILNDDVGGQNEQTGGLETIREAAATTASNQSSRKAFLNTWHVQPARSFTLSSLSPHRIPENINLLLYLT